MPALSRTSKLTTLEEAELEGKRQDLLDQQWRRRKSMFLTAFSIVGVATGVIPLQALVEAIQTALGVP